MMDNVQLANSSLNDIVFEGRNKAYGAYELRRIYGRHVMRALIIGATLLLLLVFIPVIARYLETLKPKEDLNLKTNELMEAPPLDNTQPPPPPPPPPSTPPPPPPADPPAVKAIKFTPPVVERDEKVQKQEEVPDQKELATQNVGTKTVTKGLDEAPDLTGLQGEGTKAAVADVVPDDKPVTFAEHMPELPGGGGTLAIVAAIQKATRYPAADLRNQVEGKVFASFVVDQNGKVVDVKIVKGLSGTIDAESIRAIGTLPTFVPGKQNGRAVKVQFTVPITYKIQ
ncbi:MAG: energy transducer TonB [Janthinobacterium lividum]